MKRQRRQPGRTTDGRRRRPADGGRAPTATSWTSGWPRPGSAWTTATSTGRGPVGEQLAQRGAGRARRSRSCWPPAPAQPATTTRPWPLLERASGAGPRVGRARAARGRVAGRPGRHDGGAGARQPAQRKAEEDEAEQELLDALALKAGLELELDRPAQARRTLSACPARRPCRRPGELLRELAHLQLARGRLQRRRGLVPAGHRHRRAGRRRLARTGAGRRGRRATRRASARPG